MTIILTIDNVDSLPDGGPVRYEARHHGFEIGREQHLDWTLPDPARYISGRHCEIRYENGGYWLLDVSRNGTFVNGSPNRVKSPYRLANGDRLAIGHYIVRVELEDGALRGRGPQFEPPPEPVESPPQVNDIWDTGASGPPPVDRRAFMPQPKGRRAADFSDEFIGLPDTWQPEAASMPQGCNVPPSETPFSAPADAWQSHPSPYVAPPWPAGGAESFGSIAPPPHANAPAATPSEFQRPVARPTPQGAPPAPLSAPAAASQPRDFLAALAAGAGVPQETFEGRDPSELAYEIGEFLKVSSENLTQLLRARAAAKSMTKSSSRTMISAAGNNPLKFVPGTQEALEIMFRRNRPGYLSARESVEEAFADLKRHELATYSAMQKALSRLLEDLSPETIEAKVGSSAFPLKKGRAWDLFVARWDEKSANDNGMLDVFLAYFAEAYDEASRKKG